MINLKSFVQKVLCLLIVSFSLTTKAQTSDQKLTEYFVKIQSINIDNYVKLHNTLKSDGSYEISSACIPAHILKISIINGNQDFAAFKQNFELLSQEAGISQLTILTDYNEEKFMNSCAAARSEGQ